MAGTYQLWTSYGGITNQLTSGTAANVTTWNDLLFLGDDSGSTKKNKIGVSGTIGNVSGYSVWIRDISPQYKGADNIVTKNFQLAVSGTNDSSTQNIIGSSQKYRASLDSLHVTDSMTNEEKANFYGDFAISKGFNSAYRIDTTEYLNPNFSNANGTTVSLQCKVSPNNNGVFQNIGVNDFKVKYSLNDENPFEGVGCLFGFATWPLKEDILLPEKPDKFDTTFALKIKFDEAVEDITTSDITATNATVESIYKVSSSEQWVIFKISNATTVFGTEYTLTLVKDSVSALSDSNKKNRTQTITYNCLKNDGSVIFAEKGNFLAYSTDLGTNWTNTSVAKTTAISAFIDFTGYQYYYFHHSGSKHSIDGTNWLKISTGSREPSVLQNFKNIEHTNMFKNNTNSTVRNIAHGKDSNDRKIMIASAGYQEVVKGIAISWDGGINWYKLPINVLGSATNSAHAREFEFMKHGHFGLIKDVDSTDINFSVRSVAYGNNIWIATGYSGPQSNPSTEIAYSSNGYNWTQASGISTMKGEVRASCFIDDTFIIAKHSYSSDTGKIGYSTDGNNWTFIQSPYIHNFSLVSDNSGTVVLFGREENSTETEFVRYSTDKGATWNLPTTTFSFGHSRFRDIRGIWNGTYFLAIIHETSNDTKLIYSTDGKIWNDKQVNTQHTSEIRITSNYILKESNESEIPGLSKTDVGAVLTLDVSNSLLNISDIPATWFQNLTSTTAEAKTRENSTRRNFLFSKIFEGNSTITTFDVSTNGLNMTTNTIKETIKVLKLDASTKTATINLNTDTTITDDKGFYVALENTDEKAKITNKEDNITFDIVRTGTDSDGKATYNIVKTGGTENLKIDF